MRCPGSGLHHSRRASASKPLVSALAIAEGPRRLRSRPAEASLAYAATATLLAIHVPRCGHLYPYKGTRGARIVSARKGELVGSFRGAQVRMGVCAIRRHR